MKVALIHYWLINMRGGEKTLESMCKMFPQADIYTNVVDESILSPILKKHKIYTTFIQHLPFSKKLYQKYLPLMPLALEQLDLRDYDLIISSESGPAKGVLTNSTSLHLCYCHTPMRYLWDFYQQYLASASPIVRLLMRPIFERLRLWDVISSNRVDHFVANSHTVAKRIKKHWRRNSTVVYPPVDIESFPLNTEKREDFYLCLSQLVSYKRIDLAVKVCSELNLPLIVVGQGQELKKLESIAATNIKFIGWQSTAEIVKLYSSCKALLFPGEEDFGIVPVEAMATGTPIIAYGRGGATETVIDNVTGLLFDEQSVECLKKAINKFIANQNTFDPQTIHNHAINFNEERFQKELLEQIKIAQNKM